MKSSLGLNADLPIGDLIKEAITLLWQKRQYVVRMFLPAMLILALVDWLSSSWLHEEDYISQTVFMLVSIILSILFATAAHRFTLLPKEQWDHNALHLWRRAEFRYLLRAIQISVAALIIFFAIMMVMLFLFGQELAPLVAVTGVLPALYIWGRLSITLPEMALGNKTSLKRAWKLSSGNGSRLVLVVIIIPVLLMAPFLGLYALENTALNYIAAFGSYIASLISLVMLSISYRFLLEFYQNNNGDGPESPADGFDA